MQDFSKLDVVKHALRTVIESLAPQDRFAIISFESEVNTLLSFVHADRNGIKNGIDAIDIMIAGGGTALWDGLKCGLDTVKFGKRQNATVSVILLTDGLPSPACPRGELTELQEYLLTNEMSEDPAPVHTFGIGYDLNSQLLESLSQETGGSFNFIPDGGMVGTVVINALANAGSAFVASVRLRLHGIRQDQVLGGLRCHTQSDRSVVVHIGDLRGDQIRHVLIATNNNDVSFLKSAGLLLPGQPETALSTMTWSSGGSTLSDADRIFQQLARCSFISRCSEALRVAGLNLEKGRKIISDFVEQFDKSGHPVLQDAYGQVSEALSKQEYYQRWGQHYMISLVGAHRDERCNNFKDIGVQSYKCSAFELLRSQLDSIFNGIEPPAPSLSYYHGRCDSAVMGVPVSFSSAFNNASNGCFAPSTSVMLANNSTIRIDQLRKGMQVKTPEGICAVVCVTRHEQTNGGKNTVLVSIPGGPTLTAWHPVKIDSRWCFPAWLADSHVEVCPVVWNVVLEKGHSAIYADGVEACTLGHGLLDDVVRHPYFGTDLVLHDLSSLAGWSDGIVTVRSEDVRRAQETGLVCQLGSVKECSSIVSF